MNTKEIHELIKLIDKSDLAEFKMKKGDLELQIRSKDFFKSSGQQVVSVAAPVAAPTPVSSPVPVASAPATPSTETANEESSSSHNSIKSPMVGTFYRKPSPDKEVFVKVGDKINKGDVLCVIEAMKLFNEIESEVSGTIVKVLVDDETPVEYDQPLFLIDPA